VISIRGFVVELVTANAGRWWSRLRPSWLGGDARRQATARQVGRGGRWPPGRRILGLGLVVVVLGGLWGIAAGVLVQAATDTAHPADALVVFAGGRGERLSKALVLVQQHVAPVLVISNGRDGRWQAANQLCASRRRFEVLCPQPAPDTTRGEARMVRDLAARRGWRSVVVVTSTYHARRAQLLLGRCFDGQLQIVAAPHTSRGFARGRVPMSSLQDCFARWSPPRTAEHPLYRRRGPDRALPSGDAPSSNWRRRRRGHAVTVLRWRGGTALGLQ